MVQEYKYNNYRRSTLYRIIPPFNDPNEEGLKTLWEKEKMLVTSIFSFSHKVFHTFKYKLIWTT